MGCCGRLQRRSHVNRDRVHTLSVLHGLQAQGTMRKQMADKLVTVLEHFINEVGGWGVAATRFWPPMFRPSHLTVTNFGTPPDPYTVHAPTDPNRAAAV